MARTQRRFRVNKNDSIKAKLVNKDGKLLVTLYDSGFASIDEVRRALLRKAVNPPKGTKINIFNIDTDTYWSE